jgi:hypothetical protein
LIVAWSAGLAQAVSRCGSRTSELSLACGTALARMVWADAAVMFFRE